MTKNQNDIILHDQEAINQASGFFSSISNVKPVSLHAGCKLCNSLLRQQAEDLYQKTQNYSHVHRWLEDNKEIISWSCVRNHLRSHLTNSMAQERISEYCQNMSLWCSEERKKEQRLEAVMHMLERRMIQLAAMIDGRDDSESIKITETIVKLASQMLSMQQQVDEYKKAAEPVKVVIEKIQQIVQVQLSTTPSQEVRKVLMNMVDVLEHDLGGLIQNGQD